MPIQVTTRRLNDETKSTIFAALQGSLLDIVFKMQRKGKVVTLRAEHNLCSVFPVYPVLP